jgi:hypothetical protein
MIHLAGIFGIDDVNGSKPRPRGESRTGGVETGNGRHPLRPQQRASALRVQASADKASVMTTLLFKIVRLLGMVTSDGIYVSTASCSLEPASSSIFQCQPSRTSYQLDRIQRIAPKHHEMSIITTSSSLTPTDPL